MGYKIITDSTIDMDHKMIEELGLTVVPLRFTIDGKTYKDKADLSDMPTETFYAKLREGKMSTTSQINADEFTRVFEPVLQGGEDVLYIAFSSGLSGTCQSAFIARDELKEKYPTLGDIQAITTKDYTKSEIAILLAKELIKRYK